MSKISEENNNLKTENITSSKKLWFGLVIIFIVNIIFLNSTAYFSILFPVVGTDMGQLPSAIFAQIAFWLIFLIFMVGLILFFYPLLKSKINRKKKIVISLIMFPFILRVIFVYFPLPLPYYSISKNQADVLTRKAIDSKNPEICFSGNSNILGFFNISQKYYSGPIIEDCITAVALANKDKSFCDTLMKLEPGSEEFCYRDYCREISEGSKEKEDECIKNIAIEKSDPRICDLLGSQFERERKENCLSAVNPHILKIILSGGRTDIGVCCAIDNNLLSSCKEYQSKPDAIVCLSEVAVKKDDIDICKEIWSPNIYLCYAGLAIKRKDPALCNAIPSQWSSTRDVCLNAVNSYISTESSS